jgi:preprotein translocase subunit YajC
MARIIKVGDGITVKTTSGRFRHAIVKTVTNQDSLTVSIGKGTAFAVTRASVSSITRTTQFVQ